MALAIFDLDNTLLGGDSDHAWGEFLVDRKLVDGNAFREANDRFYQQYKDGNLDIQAYLEFALQPLTRFSPEELTELHRDFMTHYIAPMRLPKADALIAKHKAAGDHCMIMTATNTFITRPIAESLGIPDIIGSEAEVIDGRYTGKPAGTPCFQEGKVILLKQRIQEKGYKLAGSTFYSDSHNDLPLLRLVENPVVVDPDEKLLKEALRQGWPVISLRD
ncbi:HAD superfamily hydrolase (TIGR01490 family) [Litorivivens lipolytica]|uniref:HAD superfamily hydrolase (TIGR01490 family) n=1 Tax=Litorivivens lipolytica TaxID=1524264 RepID=A0A7W4W6L2_9GAMM|nr:HAD superfamily hydrolase (TIGR01490 family) [Litorivivens lipolytica]